MKYAVTSACLRREGKVLGERERLKMQVSEYRTEQDAFVTCVCAHAGDAML